MTQDEKDLLDEKFKGLTTLMNAQFSNVHERLDEIKLQTTKTNGRVTELEKRDATHILNCPNITKIEKINTELEDYRIFLKYPKLFIAGIIILIIMATVSLVENIPFHITNKTPVKTEQVK